MPLGVRKYFVIMRLLQFACHAAKFGTPIEVYVIRRMGGSNKEFVMTMFFDLANHDRRRKILILMMLTFAALC